MIKKDYILRLLSDVAEAIARLLNLHEPKKAMEEMMLSIESIYKVSFTEFLKLENDDLLKDDWDIRSGIADRLGELLNTAGEVAQHNNSPEVRENLKLKALHLFELAEMHSNTYSFDRMVNISRLKEELGV